MKRHNSLGVWLACGVLLGVTALPAPAAPPDVDAKGLPAGWQAAPLGTDDTLQDKQSVSVENGVWTISAGGNDLWTENDGGLIVYTRHSGDGSVTARLLSQTGGHDDGWVKTAVGFRETLEPGSRDVHLSYTSANRLEPAIRFEQDQTPTHPGRMNGGGDGVNPRGSSFVGNGSDLVAPAGRQLNGKPLWLGVDRQGNTFGYYWSEDGKVWNRVGQVSMNPGDEFPAQMLAGILATKHGGDLGNQTSQLDNVSVSSALIAPRTIRNIQYLARDRSALIVWEGPAEEGITYNVYLVNRNLSQTRKLNATPITETSFVAEGLTNGQPHRFAISAVLNGVESPLQTPLPMVVATREDVREDFDATEAGLITPFVVPGPPVLGGFNIVNIGTATAGSVTVDGNKFVFRAGGWDIWEGADGFSFLAMPMAGDLDVQARFLRGPTEVDGGGGWELGGPMFRESMDAGARFAMAQIARANELQFKRRRIPWVTPTNTGFSRDDNEARPVTMRLVRKGDTFSAFFSEDDGRTWKKLGDQNSDTLPGFPSAPLVGIALSAHKEGQITEAEIDNFVIKPAE